MLVNNGNQEGLFRGAIMQSGGPVPVGDIEHGQHYYDALVKNAGCDSSPDTLECLRNVPYNRFKYAMDISPNFFAYQVKADASSTASSFIESAGTCTYLATACRWCFLDGATSICRCAWPCCRCTYDYRHGIFVS